VLDEARPLDHHLGDLHVPLRRFVERGGDDFPSDRCMSVTSSGRSSMKHTIQKLPGVVLRHRLRDALEQHRLAGARGRDDEAALALADRRHQVR
jgi:hypothetical protein